MSEFTVESVEWTTADRSLFGGRPEPILSAVLSTGGHTLHVSHYPDEIRADGSRIWCADAHIGPNGFPHFSHGLGSRCTSKQSLTDEVAAVVDAAAADLPGPDPTTADLTADDMELLGRDPGGRF